jgi:type IV pilus assembly protein PilB
MLCDMARKRLGEMLLDAGMISDTSLRTALAEQRRWGGSLGRTLIDLKMVSEEDLVGVLSRQLNMPVVDLDNMEIPQPVIELINGELCVQHSIVPFAQPMKFLDVAMVDPTNLGIIDELRIRTQLNVRSFLAGPKMIERAIAKYYRRGFGVFRGSNTDGLEVEASTRNQSSASIDVAQLDLAARPDGVRPFPRVAARDTLAPVPTNERTAEIIALQNRVSELEALVARDENVLRKILGLLVEKGLATREEVLERLK